MGMTREEREETHRILSYEEVLKQLKGCLTGGEAEYNYVKLHIDSIPPITPYKWIPVSERLPDEGYSVLVTRITDDNCKYVRIASYQGDCWMDNTDKFNKPNPHKVIAWQPFKLYGPQERSCEE